MRKGVLFASALLAGTVAMTISAFASVGSWQRNGIGWWFEYSDGSYVQSSWIDINNTWYYMGLQGICKQVGLTMAAVGTIWTL